MPQEPIRTSQRQPKTNVAVIVVGYNSQKYLKDCFNSLKQSLAEQDRIFFIDNASSDGSIDWVKKKYPIVEVIESKLNLGFARANNVAVTAAIKQGFQYLFLLNPDTIVDRTAIKKLKENSDNRSVLQPLLLLHDQRATNLVNTSGNVLHYLGMSYVGGYQQDYRQTIFATDLALASGAAMWVPTAIVKKIGLFDDDFFMYHEDVDFSWRARKAGYNIRLVSDSLVWHKYSFSRNPKKYYFVERNRLLFLLKNYQLKTLLLTLPMSIVNELFVIAHSILAGYFGYKIRSYFAVLQRLKSVRNYRQQAVRVVSDRQLTKYWSCLLNFTELKTPGISLYNQLSCGYWYFISRLI